MVANGEAPQRRSVSLQRRRTGGGGGGGGGAVGDGANTMLQFYTDDTAGRKLSPNTLLSMSVGFIAVVALLHVFEKLYLVKQ